MKTNNPYLNQAVQWLGLSEIISGAPESRTEDLIYERHSAYTEPVDPPPVESPEHYRRSLAEEYGVSPILAGPFALLSGLDETVKRFRNDPKAFEKALRTINTREPLYSFRSLSATSVLRNEDRQTTAIERAARLVTAAYEFYQEIKNGTAKQDAFGNRPMEMGQYGNLFGTCIHPSRATLDIYKTKQDSYIAVFYQGAAYRVDVADGSGPKSTEEILAALKGIVENRHKPHEPYPIGVLSGGNAWRRTRNMLALRRHEANRDSLSVLSDALFTLSLDLHLKPATYADTAFAIHSGNLGNRWFFASTQLVVFGNGNAGAVFSFSCTLDGNTMARFGSELYQRAQAIEISPQRKAIAPTVTELQWHVSPKAWRETHAEDAREICHQPVYYEIPDMGDDFFRSQDFRPDGIFNVAVLWASAELMGYTPNIPGRRRIPRILEHVSLAVHSGMGLNMASIGTPEARQFIDAVISGSDDNKTRELLLKALDAHKARIHEARTVTDTMPLVMLTANMTGILHKPFAFALMKMALDFDIITSQPMLLDGVEFVSRAGACLPYLSCLGLHYNILRGRITMTLMPSTKQKFAAQAFGPKVEENLRRIARILGLKNPIRPAQVV
jgi:hypothetical protein